jgi:hypothetical protein
MREVGFGGRDVAGVMVASGIVGALLVVGLGTYGRTTRPVGTTTTFTGSGYGRKGKTQRGYEMVY